MSWVKAGAVLLTSLFPLAGFAALPAPIAIATDDAGNTWLTGRTTGAVPVTSDAMQSQARVTACGWYKMSPIGPFAQVACNDAFVIKQDPSGRVMYATYLGGAGDDGGLAITVDRSGSVYIAGYTTSADFPTSPRAFQKGNAGPTTASVQFGTTTPAGDVFVTKLNADGSLAYSTLLGGARDEIAVRIQVDDAGFASVIGTTYSPDFPLAPASDLGMSFIARIAPDGSTLSFAKSFPGSVRALAVDAGGSMVVGGSVGTPAGSDGFVARLDPSGKQFVYSATLGGSGDDAVAAVALDPSGAVWVAGTTNSIAFPVLGSTGDVFLLKLRADGTRVEQAMSFGARDSYQRGAIYSLGVDRDGRVILLADASPVGFTSTADADLRGACATTQFLIRLDGTGQVAYASYLRRQVSATAFTTDGRVVGYAVRDGSLVEVATSPPSGMHFGCPVNGASYAVGRIAPAEIVTIFGEGLGPEPGVTAQTGAGRVETSLSGVEVLFNGVAAPVLYAGTGQVNVVVPSNVRSMPSAAVTVEIRNNGKNASLLEVSTAAASPGVFAVLNQDGTRNSASNPARAGSVAQLFTTGLAMTLPAGLNDGAIVPVEPLFALDAWPEVYFELTAGTVLWAGAAPGLVFGVNQVNVRIPESGAAGETAMTVRSEYVAGAPVTVHIGR